MDEKKNSKTSRIIIGITVTYFILLYGWLFLYILSGDSFAYLGLVNSLAVYLFFPLLPALVIALWAKRKELIASALVGAAIFLWFWGPLFTPHLFPAQNEYNPEINLTVMTYNVLGKQEHPAQAVNIIQNSNADLVFIQELNPQLAEEVRKNLTDDYPYQVLDPQVSAYGMGTISRYPLALSDEHMPLDWIGVPQIILMDFNGAELTLLNFHTYPIALCSIACTNENFRFREAQAQAIASFASQFQGPLIAAGDTNATRLNDTIRIILNSGLKDAWWEAGTGLGHTFPGSDLPESDRPRIGRWFVPRWLARIDYVFVSPHWQVENAVLADFDGVSDHRGVIVDLSYAPQQ